MALTYHFRVIRRICYERPRKNAIIGSRRPRVWAMAPLLVLAASACEPSSRVAPESTERPSADGHAEIQAPRISGQATRVRDLSVDESMGGHTLMRHVGKTDAELSDRLRREPQISSASTYADRATAERVVGAALASAGERLKAWQTRTGRRPNLVLQYTDRGTEPLGRSMSRGDVASALCDHALVVLRWDERRDRFYVLTSYPEGDR